MKTKFIVYRVYQKHLIKACGDTIDFAEYTCSHTAQEIKECQLYKDKNHVVYKVVFEEMKRIRTSKLIGPLTPSEISKSLEKPKSPEPWDQPKQLNLLEEVEKAMKIGGTSSED